MLAVTEDSIQQLQTLMEQSYEPLKTSFQKAHGGYGREVLVRFLKARDGCVSRAHKMLLDCLNWRIQNEIDNILTEPITPEIYKQVRDSQPIGMSGYSKEGLPVFAIGVGKSTFDKAPVDYYIHSHIQMNEYRDRVILPAATDKYGRDIGKCVKVLDMTGLKLSTLNQTIKLMTNIATIDDLYYPERTETYYIVNAPLVFYACWKVLKPRLQEQTRKKIVLLSGDGKDELLKIMDYSALPHFCRSSNSNNSVENCFSLEHPFHKEMQSYIQQQQQQAQLHGHVNQVPVRVTLPKNADKGITKALQSELKKMKTLKRCSDSGRGINYDCAGINFENTLGF